MPAFQTMRYIQALFVRAFPFLKAMKQIPEELLRERENLVAKLNAAQSMCNTPLASQFKMLLEELEKKIAEIEKNSFK